MEGLLLAERRSSSSKGVEFSENCSPVPSPATNMFLDLSQIVPYCL